MKISLIIPAYNEEKYIGSSLESIQRYGTKFFEVIVVNNASTDNTKGVAESFSFVRVVDEPKKGLTAARQRGFEVATGDLIAYIDADCRLPAQWVDIVEKEFYLNSNLVSLSGPYRYYDLPRVKNFFASLSWWLSAPLSYRLTGYMILGGNFVAKKSALLQASGFNKDISFYGEDTDIARRLAPFGKVKFKMDFFVYTSGRRLLHEGLFKTFWVYGVNFIWEVLFKTPFTKKYEDHR